MAMGVAMGLTAVVLIHSPWGQQSGAHMNPATTPTFFMRGKVAAWDAIFYILAAIAVLGVILTLLVPTRRTHELHSTPIEPSRPTE